MRLADGTFPSLPDLTEFQARKQVDYALALGWAISIEFADDPYRRNIRWEAWGNPMLSQRDGAAVMQEVRRCRGAHPDRHVKVNAFDSSVGTEAVRLCFLVQAPHLEGGVAGPAWRRDGDAVDGGVEAEE